MYLSYLFDIDDVLGIFSVWTNDLCASSNLDNKNIYSLEVTHQRRIGFPKKESVPGEVAPLASSVYQRRDPIDQEELNQYQTP